MVTDSHADTGTAPHALSPESQAVARAVGDTIRELRKTHNRSVDDVAKCMGISVRQLLRLENAENPTALRMSYVIDACRALNVEPLGFLIIALAKAFPDGWDYDGPPEESIQERVIRAQTLTRQAVQS